MPKDFKGNIALRLNFEKLHVIALDIEPEYDHEKWDPYFYWIPFDYMEYSMHHGIHGLIEIPERIYLNPKLEKLFKQNNIEFLLKEDKRTKHIGVEFDINNHFITLTKNIIDPKDSPIEFNKELTGENKEKALLGFLLELNKKAKEKQTFDYSKLKGQKLDDYSETDLKNAKIISHNIFGYNRRRHAKINAENKIDKNTGEIDYSVIEWTFLCSLYGYYKQMQKDSNMISKLGNQLIGNPRKVIDDPKIQAFSMYYTAQNELTPRKKWNEKRHGLPWMLEQSHAVIQKMQQINKQKKK